jgi:Mg-chelatase subunit ChlD
MFLVLSRLPRIKRPAFFNIFQTLRVHQMNTATTSKLSEYDFIVVIDKSGSMSETDCNGRSRWDAVQESALSFTRDVQALDSDGIGLVIFGNVVEAHDGVTADKLKEVFANHSPRGSTPLAEALTAALKLAGKSDKKDFILVFTDGVPDDKAAAAQVIRQASNGLETDDGLTILFVQVGHSPEATSYLKSLDDDLTGCKFDIVDAKTVKEAEAFATTAALVEAAIND